MLAKALPQFPVTRIAPDQVLRDSPETDIAEQTAALPAQVFRGLCRHSQERILRRTVHIILDLHHQRRHEVEVLVDFGKLVQQFHHSVIVFERVQANPRQTIFAGDQILVKRLVLVPQKNDAEDGHGWRSQSSMRDFRAKGTVAARRAAISR